MLFRRRVTIVAVLALCAVVQGLTETPAEPIDAATDAGAAEAVESEVEAEEAAAQEGLSEPDALPAADEEVAVDGGAEGEARAGAASVQWVITQKMQAQLAKLGYTRAEIADLDAERAAAIIRRSISRPTKGVPTGWNRGVRSNRGIGRSLLSAVTKPLGGLPGGPVAPLVALASVAGAVGFGVGPFSGGRSAVVERVTTPPPLELEDEIIESPGVEELWLDRQIDKLIFFLKRLLGK